MTLYLTTTLIFNYYIMRTNKDIKNQIDNLEVWDEVLWMEVTEIDDDIYTLDNPETKVWLIKDGWELFDMLYEEELDNEVNL